MSNALTVAEQDDNTISEAEAHYLRAEAIVDAINANLPNKSLPKIPKAYVFRRRDKETVSAAFHAAFDLSGGVPALVQWASDNPDKFFPLYFKLTQTDVEHVGGTTINVVSPIPTNALDAVSIGQGGQVIDLTQGADDDAPE